MKTAYQTSFDTPLGKMIAIADSEFLFLLDFAGNTHLGHKIATIQQKQYLSIMSGTTAITDHINHEIELYFAKKLQTFTIPVALCGTDFQQMVWKQLQHIPYGTTASYTDIAISLGKSQSQRAVGNANSCNNILLIIPCHRIIQQSGAFGGYSAGIERKQWLLEHESL